MTYTHNTKTTWHAAPHIFFVFFFNKGKGTLKFFRSLFLPLCQVAAQKLGATQIPSKNLCTTLEVR